MIMMYTVQCTRRYLSYLNLDWFGIFKLLLGPPPPTNVKWNTSHKYNIIEQCLCIIPMSYRL